jgi:hypothetical protein
MDSGRLRLVIKALYSNVHPITTCGTLAADFAHLRLCNSLTAKTMLKKREECAAALYVPLLHYPVRRLQNSQPPSGLRPSESAAYGCKQGPPLETIGEHWRSQRYVCGNLKQLPKFFKSLQYSPVVADYRRNSAPVLLRIEEASGILLVECTHHMTTIRLNFERFLNR